MKDRLRNMSKPARLLVLAPLVFLGLLFFAWIGGEVVKLLWNWLAPEIFGLPVINFWQALGLLTLCRILFGGCGLSGGASQRSKRRMDRRIGERIRERVNERWEAMTPEQRERFFRDTPSHSARTTPLDPNATG